MSGLGIGEIFPPANDDDEPEGARGAGPSTAVGATLGPDVDVGDQKAKCRMRTCLTSRMRLLMGLDCLPHHLRPNRCRWMMSAIVVAVVVD